ncbi:uncharacterized protein TM35_000441680 [Trypanosoma theileri]|uniref:Uncharacterized protein n=1 Tax=Trypanosoma theileri TaxID=67003 RepID=A0A1X0NID3_9TRYP|nr:uncharacterized protein TM35_000441680 [Trypanosoma theileri]ORC84512.1 hypothetical protein TM35_000441680 [Trypanosoma theileri]
MFPPNQKYIKQRTPLTSQPISLNRYSGNDNSSHEISDGWSHALLLADLSKLCSSSSSSSSSISEVSKSGEKNSLQSLSTPKKNEVPSISMEEESLVYLLNHCRFPVEQWWISLKLLTRWRQLYIERTFSGNIRTDNKVFPTNISSASKAHLMRNLSYCTNSWVDVLRLYEIATRDKTNHDNVYGSQIESEKEYRRKKSNQGGLRWMRHIALTSLLQAGQWKESLQFYRHMLYQRETPSHICTGHLVQRLGEVGCWTAVINIFELNLKLLEATRSRDALLSVNFEDSKSLEPLSTTTVEASQKKATEWGTMFSMALDVVSRVCQKPKLAVKMFDEAHKKNINGSLFRWDGNFLSAVQALPSEQDRISILRRARVADQLDIFKLIRGLIHHKKWIEAIALFEEGLTHKKISRKEIGRCRLGILHTTNTDNVQIVLHILQKISGRPTGSLRLNDAEVECVISKVPPLMESLIGSGKSISKAHWQFCLQVLSENYTCFSRKGNIQQSLRQDERRPTIHMLSLLLRNSSIPWYKALGLLSLSQILDNRDVMSGNEKCISSTSSKALMFNHIIEILHAQGEYQRMKELLEKILRTSELSPSSGMLEFVPLEFLLLNEKEPDRNKLKVEDTVLYHYIQNTLNWSRALSLLLLVEQQRASVISDNTSIDNNTNNTTNNSNNSMIDPLHTLPASVHCGALKMLRRCVPQNNLWILSLHYFQHIVSNTTRLSGESLQNPKITSHLQLSNKEMEVIIYSIMYETLLNLLSESPIVSGSLREKMCFQLVERVLEICMGRIPTHMLLPNQMDRLLPRFSSGKDDLLNVEQRTRVGMKLARCVIGNISCL